MQVAELGTEAVTTKVGLAMASVSRWLLRAMLRLMLPNASARTFSIEAPVFIARVGAIDAGVTNIKEVAGRVTELDANPNPLLFAYLKSLLLHNHRQHLEMKE